MKGLILFGAVMFLALVFSTSALAEDSRNSATLSVKTFSAKSSGGGCPCRRRTAARKQRNPPPAPPKEANVCPGNLIWIEAIRSCIPPPLALKDRCLNPTDSQVEFRLRNSNSVLQQHPFLTEDNWRVYFCLGSEERFLYLHDITNVRRFRASPIPNPQSVSCPAATDAVRAMLTVIPAPYDPAPAVNETVELSVTFLADGTIGPIDVEKSPGRAYADSARKAAEKIKFIPAWKNDRRICVTQSVTYSFGPQTSKPGSPKSSNQVVLLSPYPRQLFKEKQRNIRFSWESIPGADHYFLEVRYSSVTSTDWVLYGKVPVHGTSHQLEMPGPYPIRWRVQAMRQNGTLIADSDWWRFGYEK